jgi:hypothetical protein
MLSGEDDVACCAIPRTADLRDPSVPFARRDLMGIGGSDLSDVLVCGRYRLGVCVRRRQCALRR